MQEGDTCGVVRQKRARHLRSCTARTKSRNSRVTVKGRRESRGQGTPRFPHGSQGDVGEPGAGHGWDHLPSRRGRIEGDEDPGGLHLAEGGRVGVGGGVAVVEIGGAVPGVGVEGVDDWRGGEGECRRGFSRAPSHAGRVEGAGFRSAGAGRGSERGGAPAGVSGSGRGRRVWRRGRCCLRPAVAVPGRGGLARRRVLGARLKPRLHLAKGRWVGVGRAVAGVVRGGPCTGGCVGVGRSVAVVEIAGSTAGGGGWFGILRKEM